MARGSSQRGSRNKRKYSGGQTDERKQQILKKLRALKERKENTRHSRQQKNYMDSFFGYIDNTGRFQNVVVDGERHYENITTEMFAEFTTTLTTTKNGKEIMLKKRTYDSYKSALYKAMKENGITPSATLKHNINTQQHL